MNSRALIVAALLGAVGATQLACGPKQGSPSSLIRTYVGFAAAAPPAAALEQLSLTLNYLDDAFFLRVNGGYFWRGTITPFAGPGSFKLKVTECTSVFPPGADPNCSVGLELYGYESPEIAVQLATPADRNRPAVLINAKPCTELTSTPMRFLNTVFGDTDDPNTLGMIGELALVAPEDPASGFTVSGTSYRFATGGGLDSPSALAAETLTCESSGSLYGVGDFESLFGNPETGLYTGIMRIGGSSRAWVGMSGTESTTATSVSGSTMIGFEPRESDSDQRCPVRVPATGAFNAFRIEFVGSAQLSHRSICSLETLEPVQDSSGDGVTLFRVSSGGLLEVGDVSAAGSTNYDKIGFARHVGGRLAAIILERSGGGTPAAAHRFLIEAPADEE